MKAGWIAAKLLLGLAATLLASGCEGPVPKALATPTATPVSYATPPGRRDAAMAYDPQTRKLIMFGGIGSTSAGINDTWAWDGKGWTQLHPATVPSGFYFFMASDAATQRLVMFIPDPTGLTIWSWTKGNWMKLGDYAPAGINSLTYDGDLAKVIALAPGAATLTWDGSLLQQLPTPHRVGSYLCCLTYDSVTRQALYLGNTGKSGEINQTWIFDGGDWVLSQAATPAGQELRTVEDPATSNVVMVGGTFQAPQAGGTWTWDGTTWQRLNVRSPSVTSGASIAYDAATRQIVLFGGVDAFGQAVSDTWTWNGRSWQKR